MAMRFWHFKGRISDYGWHRESGDHYNDKGAKEFLDHKPGRTVEYADVEDGDIKQFEYQSKAKPKKATKGISVDVPPDDYEGDEEDQGEGEDQ